MSDDNEQMPPEAPQVDPEGIVEISVAEYRDLVDKAGKAEEYLTLAKYAKAEFINYQDRVRRDKEDWVRQAVGSVIMDILPALDGFSLAKFEDEKLTEAMRMLEREFLRVLAKHGVTPINTSGQTFDPLLHEAVAAEQGGTILQEVRRGWLVNGRVLRAASVRIVRPTEVY